MFSVLVVAGCKQVEDLESSVNSRWKAITANDLEKAYEYYSHGYKEAESLDGFKMRIATAQLSIKWSQGLFKSKSCSDENVCEVSVEVVYSYSFPKRSLGAVENVTTVLKEDWIKIDGKWLHVPKSK